MKAVDDILRKMRELADGQAKNKYSVFREMSTDSFRAYADRSEVAVNRQHPYEEGCG